ncbi:uncharacterized protein LOC121388560 [Gigantopelta aegis]|uniref:uncharacterized protein LOC121388560 n=1 Tax=Gigantopelta aegis TaxID=1735272 RepID=UPI001B88D6E4|nr:uncharacterized protein LOC121388560 [Gigantopelta aegis]
MSARQSLPSAPPPNRKPIANRNPAPPTATISPGPSEPLEVAENIKRQTPQPGVKKTHQEPHTPSKYAPDQGMPVRTAHKYVTITPRNAYEEHDRIETPHTLLNPLSDVPVQGSAVSKETRTIKDEIVLAGGEGRTFPSYNKRRNMPFPYSSRTDPLCHCHHDNRKLANGWSTVTANGSMDAHKYDKSGSDEYSRFETFMWLNRHNKVPGWNHAVAERDRYYVETPWSDRRYPGQEPHLSDTDIWTHRNFGKDRDWLDTPYYDGRYYVYDRRYLDYEVGPETREGFKRYYKSYQSDPGAVNTARWLRRHYETAPDYTDYEMWKAGQRARRRNLAKIQKERQRHWARRRGNVFRAPSPYDERDDLDTVIQPRVHVMPHEEYREPRRSDSMVTVDGSAVLKPRRKLLKDEWELELHRMRHKKEAKRYRKNAKLYREKELVPEWIDAIGTPPFRDFEHKSKLVTEHKYEPNEPLYEQQTYSRESEVSSVPHPAQTPRVLSRVGEYNTYVGNYDTFHKFDHYYNRRKDGAPLNKYGQNYKSRNMGLWHWN